METLTDREEDWKRKSKGEIRRGEEGRMSLTLFSAKSNDYHMFLRYGTEKDFNPIRWQIPPSNDTEFLFGLMFLLRSLYRYNYDKP